MPVVHTTVIIERPPTVVFAYITTAGLWPQWQPAVLAVSGVTEQPLRLGEQATTEYRVVGRTGVITWEVTRCLPWRYWTVEGKIAGQANGGAVAYTLAREGHATRLVRTFRFETSQPVTRLQDAITLHRGVALEAEGALARLKAMLEVSG